MLMPLSPGPLHVLHLNYAFDDDVPDAAALIDRYGTLREWARAVRDAGASRVTVLQRFREDAVVSRDGQAFELCRSRGPGRVSAAAWPRHLHTQVHSRGADVVHVHGMEACSAMWHLRRVLPETTVLVVQDHASPVPQAQTRGLRALAVRRVRQAGLRGADALFFTSAAQAEPWRQAGILHPDQPVYPIIEASTTLHERYPAHRVVAATGGPEILWVGRLVANKDPLTVIQAFATVLREQRSARLTLVCASNELRSEVEQAIDAFSLRRAVTCVERLAPADLAALYARADVFVSGSHREGSGYSLIEAMAFGLVPAVTDIPSFRAITGDGRTGCLWNPGDVADCTSALRAATDLVGEQWRRRCRDHFDAHLSWHALGRAALAAYTELAARRRGGA